MDVVDEDDVDRTEQETLQQTAGMPAQEGGGGGGSGSGSGGSVHPHQPASSNILVDGDDEAEQEQEDDDAAPSTAAGEQPVVLGPEVEAALAALAAVPGVAAKAGRAGCGGDAAAVGWLRRMVAEGRELHAPRARPRPGG